MGKRCQTEEDIKNGIKGKCCQAITHNGTKCSRKATINIDLKKNRVIFGMNIPKVNCCFFCKQHASILLGFALTNLSNILAESQLSWHDYLTLKPEYLDTVHKEMTR